MKGGWLANIVFAGGASLILGCGGSGESTYKVTGNVKVAGTPMQDITVTFMPVAGRPASGITDSSGNFTLATFSKGDGAVAGKHKVSFAYRPIKPGDGSGKPANIPDSSMSKPGAGGAGATTPGAPPTPFNAKYTNPETSGIEVEIGSGKPTTFTWDLEK